MKIYVYIETILDDAYGSEVEILRVSTTLDMDFDCDEIQVWEKEKLVETIEKDGPW